jgi:deoxyadenosine/deoxycytidine kinase
MRIEVCGGIAAGKTTLATLLAGPELSLTLENFGSNPFWAAFYKEPGRHIFETEITFLLQHYHALRVSAEERRPVVADFSPILDAAYADIGLTGRRSEIFELTLNEVLTEIGPPTLLVHLECPAEVEMERIRRRGRNEENGVTVGFLSALNAAVSARVEALATRGCVYRIDSSATDFARDVKLRADVRRAVLAAADRRFDK